jgi:hypothetical protein
MARISSVTHKWLLSTEHTYSPSYSTWPMFLSMYQNPIVRMCYDFLLVGEQTTLS